MTYEELQAAQAALRDGLSCGCNSDRHCGAFEGLRAMQQAAYYQAIETDDWTAYEQASHATWAHWGMPPPGEQVEILKAAGVM